MNSIIRDTQLITSILHTIGDCTVDELTLICSAATPKLSKSKVKKILDGGVQHGFVGKYGKMYTVLHHSETDGPKRKSKAKGSGSPNHSKAMSKAKKAKVTEAEKKKLKKTLREEAKRHSPYYDPDDYDDYSDYDYRFDLEDTPRPPSPPLWKKLADAENKRLDAEYFRAPEIERRAGDREAFGGDASVVARRKTEGSPESKLASAKAKLETYVTRRLPLDLPSELSDEDE